MTAILLSPLGRELGAVAIALTAMVGIYGYGHHAGTTAESARWQAAVAAEQKRQADASNAALEAAQARGEAREAEISSLQSKVDAYEAELAKRSAGALCPVSDDDARRLSDIR